MKHLKYRAEWFQVSDTYLNKWQLQNEVQEELTNLLYLILYLQKEKYNYLKQINVFQNIPTVNWIILVI